MVNVIFLSLLCVHIQVGLLAGDIFHEPDFLCAALRMPLADRSAACVEDYRELFVRHVGIRQRLLEYEVRSLIRSKELAVGIESSLLLLELLLAALRIRPLYAVRISEPIPCHAGEITRLAGRDLAEHIEALLRGLPSLDSLSHTEGFRDAENALVVGDFILASLKDRSHCGHASLEIDICSGFLDARDDREVDSCILGALDRVVNILNNKEFKLLCCRCKCLVVRPAVTRVRT